MTKKEQILNQFKSLLTIGETVSAARIYCDWAYMYQPELNDILANSDMAVAQAVSDHVTNMSGDYVDQP